MKELAGKVAVVTGGGSGIGEGLVQAFAEEGMDVVVADIDEQEAQRVAGDATTGGARRALAVRTDVTDRASVEDLAERVYAELGSTDVLCNNAGVLLFGSVAEMRTADWRWVFEVNVFGVVHCLEAFLPRMRAQAGEAHIVNTGSPAGFCGGARSAIYSASKNAVVAISEALRQELAAEEIGVSVLCPSKIDTRILDAQRNRQPAFGPRAPDPLGTGTAREDAIEPVVLGRFVCDAIRKNELYIFNTPEVHRARMLGRFDDITGALDRAEATLRG